MLRDSHDRRIPGLVPTVAVIGEALIDVMVGADGVELRRPGGSPMNVSFGLARMGVPTRLITSIGDDGDGHQIVAHLQSAGVKLDAASVVPGAVTSTASAVVGRDGSPSYSFDLSWDLPAESRLPAEYGVIHTGSIAAVLSPGADRTLELFRSARGEAIRSFDPNIRPSITPDRDMVRARVEQFIACTDVLKLSDEDAAWLQPDKDEAAVVDWALGLGVKFFVMTRGARGCTVVTPSQQIVQGAVPTRVADTIGAGDAFMSALLAGLSRWGLLDLLRHDGISESDLSRLAALAARAASLAVAQVGAQPPTWAQVRSAA